MRNEAQLAGVIAHESGHFLRRHMIRMWRDMRLKSDLFSIGAMIAGVAGGAAGVNTGDITQLAQLGTILSLFKYNRTMEAEADAMGARLLAEQGYPAVEMANTWQQLIGEMDAPTAQVLIEARIIEVGSDFRDKLGVRWSADGENAFSDEDKDGALLINSSSSHKKVFAGLPGGGSFKSGVIDASMNLDVLVQFLRKNTDATVLAEPQLNIADNELGKLFVGAQVPFISGSLNTDVGGRNDTFQYKDVGVILEERSVEEKAKYHFYLAKLYAKGGRNELALQYLRKSLEEGFKEKKKIEEEADFAALRELPEVKELLAKEQRVL
jgi:hypothetical protein